MLYRYNHFDLTCHQNPQCNIGVTRKKLGLWSQILALSVALGNPFHAPSHTLWEPLGVQYWKRRNEWTRWVGGDWWADEVRGQDWHFKKLSEIDFRLSGGTEGFRHCTCFTQKKKEREGGTKEPSALRTLNPDPLSCPPPLLLSSVAAGNSLNKSLWRGHYHRITNTNAFTDKTNKGTWICRGNICVETYWNSVFKHNMVLQDLLFSQC